MSESKESLDDAKRQLDAKILEEAGMTIHPHNEVTGPSGILYILHKIDHDWACLLSRCFVSFDNIIHEEAVNKLPVEQQRFTKDHRRQSIIWQNAIPENECDRRIFYQRYPQAEEEAAERLQIRMKSMIETSEICKGEKENKWCDAFKDLLKGLGKGRADSKQELSWLSNLEGIKMDSELCWTLGRKELERNRKLHPERGLIEIKYSRPDIQIGFAIQSRDAEFSSKESEAQTDVFLSNEHMFRYLQDDPVVNNFTCSTIDEVADGIRKIDPDFISLFPQDPSPPKKKSGEIQPLSIGCFPWLICEHKKQYLSRKEQEYRFFQAANGCAVALTLLARLSQRGTSKLLADDVRPVFALTSIDVRLTLTQQMHEIWRGSMLRHIQVLELAIFMDRLYFWAIKSLKPWISSCLDQWLYLMRSDQLSVEGRETDGLPASNEAGQRNLVSNDRRSGQDEAEHTQEVPTYAPQADAAPISAPPPEERIVSTKGRGSLEGSPEQYQDQSIPLRHRSSANAMRAYESRNRFTPVETVSGREDLGNGLQKTLQSDSWFVFGKNAYNDFSFEDRSVMDGSTVMSFSNKTVGDASPTPSTSTSESYHKNGLLNLESQSSPCSKHSSTGSVLSHEAQLDVAQSGQFCTYNDPKLQDLLHRSYNLLKDIELELRVGDPTTSTNKYLEMAMKISPKHSFKKHRVAFIGSGGVGKSSLISSLLGVPYLAPSSSYGKSETSFATEFHHEPDLKDAEFLVEVVYQTADEINATIAELVSDFRYLRNSHGDQSHELIRRQNIASSALMTLFENKPQWKDYCEDPREGSYDRAVSQLIRWSREFDTTTAAGGKFQTNAECTTALRGLASSNCWPLVEVARVYVKSAKIDEDIILLDLPGLRDTNDQRSASTEKKISCADHIFLVTNKSRGLADQGLQSDIKSVFALGKRIVLEGCAPEKATATIVYTGTDEIEPDEYKDELRKNVSTARQLDELEKRIEEEKDVGKAYDLKQELKQLCIKTCNGNIRNSLVEMYGKQLKFEVFCVSNKEYRTCRQEQDCALCEIPQLRRFCSGLVAKDRWENTHTFVHLMLPGFVAMMRSWLDGHSPDLTLVRLPSKAGQGLAEDSIDVVQQRLESALRKYKTKLQARWNKSVDGIFSRHWRKWDKRAEQIVESWADIKYQTHQACCRKFGELHHGDCDGKKVLLHWNQELLQPVKELAFNDWIRVEQDTLKDLEQFVDKIHKQVSSLAELSKRHAVGLTQSQLESFPKVLLKLLKQLQRDCAQLSDDFKRQLIFLRGSVFENQSRTSSIRKVMKPIFKRAMDCSLDGYGRMVDSRQISIVKQVHIGIFENFAQVVASKIYKMSNDITQQADDILMELNSSLDELKVGLQVRHPEQHLDDADMQLFGILKEHLESWEARVSELATCSKELPAQ